MGLIKTRVTEMNLKPSQGLPIMLCYVHEIYNHRGAPWQIKRTPQPRVISVWFQMSHDQGNTHDWTDQQTELSPFNVSQMILLAETQSVNSLPRISVIKMWSGMPLKRWVREKNGEKGRNETRSTRPASLQQPPPSKVYNHTPSHRHADTGTITHTHSRVGNSRKAGTMPQPPPKNLAGLNRKSTRWHCSILDNKLGWQGVCIYIHIHTRLSSPHTEHVSLFFHRYAYIYIYIYTLRNHS